MAEVSAPTIEVKTGASQVEASASRPIILAAPPPALIPGPQGPTGDTGPAGPQGSPGNLSGIQGTLGSVYDLPADAEVGDAYIIDGELWIYQG